MGNIESKKIGTILPDFHSPSAVMVPHYPCTISPVLEGIAEKISVHCGVIILSNALEFSQAFVARQTQPDRFSLVTAPFDTPWIRDRSPIAIDTSEGIQWCIPSIDYTERPQDNVLFDKIVSKPIKTSPIKFLPQGNMVAGVDGLVLITDDVLRDNKLNVNQLNSCGHFLGIRHWLVFSGFEHEMTGHADVHVRVLSPDLIAVAWNQSSKQDQQVIVDLEAEIYTYYPEIEIIRIPIRSEGKQYASLLNWIQLGEHLIIPRFSLTKAIDIEETKKLLHAHHFSAEFIYSPTLEYGGSLHCLTASIFV